MKILIVEDQQEKSADLIKFFEQWISKSLEINVRQSLSSGLKQVVLDSNYDLIVLDMSMPNFDPSEDDPSGGTPESFAGKEFLAQMKLRNIKIPVVVVTQYATFARGQITLEELDSFFKSSYAQVYLGSVYYSSASDTWKKALKVLVLEKGIK
jgi:CheY-like chemotaxis protein